MKRRDFLKFLGISSSSLLASFTLGKKKAEKLIPRLVPPEEGIMTGEPFFQKTTCLECPAQCGAIIKSYEKIHHGRNKMFPVKLEGNPEHPINQGALCIRGQASLTRAFHPDRIKTPLQRKGDSFQKIPWEEAYQEIANALRSALAHGKSNAYLSSRTTGTLSKVIDLFCKKLQIERLPEYEPFSYSTLRETYRILFDQKSLPAYKIEKSDLLITVGADLFETFLSPVAFAKQVAQAKEKRIFRHWHIEPHLSLTGLNADRRISIRPGSERFLLSYILHSLQEDEPQNKLPKAFLSALPSLSLKEIAKKTALRESAIQALTDRLKKAKSPLLIVGGVTLQQKDGLLTALLGGLIQWQTGAVQELMNFANGEDYDRVSSIKEMKSLSKRLSAKEIGVLFLSRTNPVKDLPTSLSFAENIRLADSRIGLGDFLNETLKSCDIVLPLSHFSEAWGDASPRKNIINLIQPAMKPLHHTRPEGDILLQLLLREIPSLKEAATTPFPVSANFHDYLEESWAKELGEKGRAKLKKDGFFLKEAKDQEKTLQDDNIVAALQNAVATEPPATTILVQAPSLRFFDGRSQQLPLLQEIPDPITTITYGSWILLSSKTAKKQKIVDGDEIQISTHETVLKIPVKTHPYLSENILVIQPCMIETQPFSYDEETGEPIYMLENVQIMRTGKHVKLPMLSGSTAQDGRGIIPYPIHKRKEHKSGKKESLYPEHEHKNYRWAMGINLDACTGCSACVAACYIENNIPVVGKREHLKDREMAWIRIEPYYEGNKKVHFIPMMCQQCDNAPCEPVCPVYATMHTSEGLNAQIYNRCVGTRYCENNCPYKVRAFNWFAPQRRDPEPLMLNPETFIRPKGVMEKCTFCVQRIRRAHDIAKDENRHIRDGDVVPACAESCPSNAIVFGNIKDKKSKIYKYAKARNSYRIFEHLGVDPSVYYLPNTKKEKQTS